jgi:hypothetical protein
MDIEPVELAITSGTGWGASTVKHTLCQECHRLLDQWFVTPSRRTHHNGAREFAKLETKATA